MAISITSWLDPALKYFSDQSGIPVDQYSSQVGGEGIANVLEMSADFFTKGWLNRAIQGGAGLLATSYAVWGKDVPDRLRRELLAVGTHELFRVVDVKPGEILEVRQSLSDFIASAQAGDWNTALSSVLTTPAEIQAAMGGLIPGGPPPAPQAPETPKPSYVVQPEMKAPARAAAWGKYQITG